MVIAEPNFAGAALEVEVAFGEHFGIAIGGGDDFDADFGSEGEAGGAAVGGEAVFGDPGDVG